MPCRHRWTQHACCLSAGHLASQWPRSGARGEVFTTEGGHRRSQAFLSVDFDQNQNETELKGQLAWNTDSLHAMVSLSRESEWLVLGVTN